MKKVYDEIKSNIIGEDYEPNYPNILFNRYQVMQHTEISP